MDPGNKLMIIITFFIMSCKNNDCDVKVNTWIKDAPESLKEFKSVQEEVLKNHEFVKTYSKNESIFLISKDTAKYAEYNLPLLIKWFRDGKGFINLGLKNEEKTIFAYRQCQSGKYTANAIVSKIKTHSYKSAVKTVDSIDLEEGWFGVVTKCDECND